MTNAHNTNGFPSQLEEGINQLQLEGCKRIEIKYRTAKVTMRVTYKGISVGEKGATFEECLQNLQHRLLYYQTLYQLSLR